MDKEFPQALPQIAQLAIAIACALAMGPVVHAQGTDVIVSRLAGFESEVSIDINPVAPDNLVVMGVSEATNDHMNAIFSLDTGQHWNIVELGERNPVCTDSPSAPTAGDCINGFRIDPSVAFDDTGRVYVAYGRTRSNSPAHLVVCRSGDGGRSYEGCVTVAENDGGDKWHLATGPDPTVDRQNIYISWDNHSGIVLARSIDGGENFSSPNSGSTADFIVVGAGDRFAEPAVGPNGEVYVSWVSGDTIRVACSQDGGVNFSAPTLVTGSSTNFRQKIPAQPDNGVFRGPTIEVDRSGGPHTGRVYLAYTDESSSGVAHDIDIFVRYSLDGGSGCRGLTPADWSAPKRVNDDFDDPATMGTNEGINSQFLPWLDLDQRSGYAAVVWYDARNDPAHNELVDIYLAATDGSVDATGRLIFAANVKVTDAPSDADFDPYDFTSCTLGLGCCETGFNCELNSNFREYIGAAANNCTVHVVWTDSSISLRHDYMTDQIDIPGCQPIDVLDAHDASAE